MSFQSGSSPIGNGVNTLDVVFPARFGVVPDIVLPSVSNIIDGSALLITATVTARSTTGFTVQLDGNTDSANYVLDWMAGSSGVFIDTLTALGKRLTDLSRITTEPGATDILPITTLYPLPRTQAMEWQLLRSFFARWTAVPASDAAAGVLGQVALDANYFYLRDASLWRRIPVIPDGTWDNANALLVRRAGTYALVSGVQSTLVLFDTPFVGTVPVVDSLVISNSTGGDVLMLSGMVTTIDVSGFTVVLNASPDSGNYYVTYRAYQPA